MVIRLLIYGNFLMITGWGFINPVFAIFIISEVIGGSIKLVGFYTAIYWIVKSLIQLPIARYIDKNNGERDDYWALVLGSSISVIMPFFLIFTHQVWQIFLISIFLGLGDALSVPAFYGIFTRHVDKFRESFEWSVNSVSVGIGAAVAAALTGIIVDGFGFRPIFILAGILNFLGLISLVLLYKNLLVSDIKK